MPGFGCERCYGEDAATAWGNLRLLETVTTLVDRSHFDVSIRCCLECKQRFGVIYTEFTDWIGGQDPQYSTLIPVDDAEVATILAMGQHPDLKWIGALGENRRWLCSDRPRDASARIDWRTGTAHLTEGY